MEVEIVAKEVIKPSSPTSKNFTLSFFDQQLYGCLYNKLFFFYHNCSDSVVDDTISERTRSLKLSLSEVLTHFYPLAGKIKNNFLVLTSEDDGVDFLEARVNRTLSDYLAKPDVDFLPKLVPDDYLESWERPLLIVQASFFTCGGLAIGINISHRIADAASFTYFVNAWAGTAIGEFNNFKKPTFTGSIVFPPSDHFVGVEAIPNHLIKTKLVKKRFVFLASSMTQLQEKATKIGTRPPSRVKTVSAFLWRILMKMSELKAGGFKMPSTLSMSMNLRSILPPPISDQSFGNLIEVFTVHNHSKDTELPSLISLLTEEIQKLRKIYQDKILQGERCFIGSLGSTFETMELITSGVPNNFSITSWCRFPLYDADFGWGKPTWVANYCRVPWILLTDTSDGSGIEAWISLAEEDMEVFRSDEELSAYATLDPSVD